MTGGLSARHGTANEPTRGEGRYTLALSHHEAVPLHLQPVSAHQVHEDEG